MWKHVHACRYVWNYMLNQQKYEFYVGNGPAYFLTAYELMGKLTSLKKDGEHDFLYEVSNHSLQRICSDLAIACTRYIKGISRFPKFKGDRAKNAFPVTEDVSNIYFTPSKVHLQKIGNVKYKTNYPIPLGNKEKFINPRVTYTKNNKWVLTVTVEIGDSELIDKRRLSRDTMGIDLGVKQLAVVVYGDNEPVFFGNINKSVKVKKLVSKLKHIQRTISRKQRTNGGNWYSKNILKYRKIENDIYRRLTNIRKDYIHKITKMLTHDARPNTIIMEDLAIKNMVKNRNLSRVIMEQNWGAFIHQIEYKAERVGIRVIKADRFYPSSKICSDCGSYIKTLKLNQRTFKCPNCGLSIDRDVNAAINLSRYASHIQEM